jgi:hypothetical protein
MTNMILRLQDEAIRGTLMFYAGTRRGPSIRTVRCSVVLLMFYMGRARLLNRWRSGSRGPAW